MNAYANNGAITTINFYSGGAGCGEDTSTDAYCGLYEVMEFVFATSAKNVKFNPYYTTDMLHVMAYGYNEDGALISSSACSLANPNGNAECSVNNGGPIKKLRLSLNPSFSLLFARFRVYQIVYTPLSC